MLASLFPSVLTFTWELPPVACELLFVPAILHTALGHSFEEHVTHQNATEAKKDTTEDTAQKLGHNESPFV